MLETNRTYTDLKQKQSLPLELKIRMTKMRIEEWYNAWEGNVYVSFSGGKDSTVLKHIVDSMYDNVPSVFVNTGLEYPEIYRFVNEIRAGMHPGFRNDVEILYPEKSFKHVIKDCGYPIISKEVAECVRGARTYIDDIRGGYQRNRYGYFYRRLTGQGEYASHSKNSEAAGMAHQGQQSSDRGYP